MILLLSGSLQIFIVYTGYGFEEGVYFCLRSWTFNKFDVWYPPSCHLPEGKRAHEGNTGYASGNLTIGHNNEQ